MSEDGDEWRWGRGGGVGLSGGAREMPDDGVVLQLTVVLTRICTCDETSETYTHTDLSAYKTGQSQTKALKIGSVLVVILYYSHHWGKLSSCHAVQYCAVLAVFHECIIISNCKVLK